MTRKLSLLEFVKITDLPIEIVVREIQELIESGAFPRVAAALNQQASQYTARAQNLVNQLFTVAKNNAYALKVEKAGNYSSTPVTDIIKKGIHDLQQYISVLSTLKDGAQTAEWLKEKVAELSALIITVHPAAPSNTQQPAPRIPAAS